MAPQTLFEQVVRVTYVYLGPAADRFVTRQITNHLHKQPERLKRGDLRELVDWIKVAMGFLTEDQAMVDEYINRLQSLSQAAPKRKAVSSHVQKVA